MFGILRKIAREVIIKFNTPLCVVKKLYKYDCGLFIRYSGALNPKNKSAQLAKIIMAYHVIEKGLTMPRRRLDFGHEAVLNLIGLIDDFEASYGSDSMVDHASGVVKQYLKLHADSEFNFPSDSAYWSGVRNFCQRKSAIAYAQQLHFTKELFFSRKCAAFPEFAASRHTCRHFQGEVSSQTINDAVSLAMTAPSACNRQYTRVHSIENKELKDKIFDLQHGSRGFGSDADKVLLVTTDLSGVRWIEERNDPFTNAGIFLMNLCYALHYYEVAHCILNWSVGRYADKEMHTLLNIPANERIVAIVACGGMPDEVDIASSPRKDIKDVLVVHQ